MTNCSARGVEATNLTSASGSRASTLVGSDRVQCSHTVAKEQRDAGQSEPPEGGGGVGPGGLLARWLMGGGGCARHGALVVGLHAVGEKGGAVVEEAQQGRPAG